MYLPTDRRDLRDRRDRYRSGGAALGLLTGGEQRLTGLLSGSRGEVLTVSRASSKTAFDGSVTLGNDLPLVDAQGLLIEAAHTNQAPHSEDFSQGGTWQPYNSGVAAPTITPNAGIAPDGTLSAARYDLPAVDVGSGQFSAILSGGYNASPAITWSVNLRGVSGPGTVYLFFQEFTTNAFTAVACNYTTTWQRFTLTVPTTQGGYVHLGVRNAAGMASQAAQSFYVCGGNVTEKAYAQSPVVTTSGSVACAADVVTLPATSVPVAAGSISFDFTPLWNETNKPSDVMMFDTTNNLATGFAMDLSLGTVGMFFGSSFTQGNALTWTPGRTYHLVFRWGAGAYTVTRDGVLVTSATGVTMPSSHSTMYVGCFNGSSNFADGHLSNFIISG